MPNPSLHSRPIVFTEIEQFGGAERVAMALCRWLTERSLECHVVAYDDRCNLGSYSSFPVSVVRLDCARGPWSKITALHRYFENRPMAAPRPLMSGYQPAMHATLAGMRGFHTLMHDTPSLFDDPIHDGVLQRVRRLASNEVVGLGLRSGGATIVASEFLRDECLRDFRIHADIARMGGYAMESAFLPGRAAKIFDGTIRLLSVCRIEANKRIDWLLDALAKLESRSVAPLRAPLSQLCDWHFDLAGKGSGIDQLRERADRLGIGDRVTFHGFVSDEALETMYAGSDLFLMPAVQGYGIPAIESLSRGIPVFLHRESGVSDILLDTPWATVMRGGQPETAAALAKALDGLLRGSHLKAAVPELPTEDGWAERVATLAGGFSGYIL